MKKEKNLISLEEKQLILKPYRKLEVNKNSSGDKEEFKEAFLSSQLTEIKKIRKSKKQSE